MKYNVISTDPFKRKFKKLAKKYRSLKSDISPLFDSLATDPNQGTHLGKDCYKIRLAISSKGKGKSAGARIITYVRVSNKNVSHRHLR